MAMPTPDPAPSAAPVAEPSRALAPSATVPAEPAAISGPDIKAHSTGPQLPALPSATADPSGSGQTGPRADASWAGNVPPPYPAASRRLREEGDVRLSVHIDEAGRVTDVKLVRSSGSPRLDAAAIETVKKWRFKPATVEGRPTASWYEDWLWTFRVDP